MQRPNNARFWEWLNGGLVKLTIVPGGELVRTTGGPHDEGYSYETERWELSEDGRTLTYSWLVTGRDCDGPHESFGSCSCPVELSAAVEQIGGYGTPQWQRQHAGCRDVYAEMMNY